MRLLIAPISLAREVGSQLVISPPQGLFVCSKLLNTREETWDSDVLAHLPVLRHRLAPGRPPKRGRLKARIERIPVSCRAEGDNDALDDSEAPAVAELSFLAVFLESKSIDPFGGFDVACIFGTSC